MIWRQVGIQRVVEYNVSRCYALTQNETKQTKTMAYVIKSWRAGDQPDAHTNFVTVTGRKEGIISYVLAHFGIDPTVSITVSDSRIEFSEASLSGSVRRLIPLPSWACFDKTDREKGVLR